MLRTSLKALGTCWSSRLPDPFSTTYVSPPPLFPFVFSFFKIWIIYLNWITVHCVFKITFHFFLMLQEHPLLCEVTSFLLSLPAPSHFRFSVLVSFNRSVCSFIIFSCVGGLFLYCFLLEAYGVYLNMRCGNIPSWVKPSHNNHLCCSYCVSNAITFRNS